MPDTQDNQLQANAGQDTTPDTTSTATSPSPAPTENGVSSQNEATFENQQPQSSDTQESTQSTATPEPSQTSKNALNLITQSAQDLKDSGIALNNSLSAPHLELTEASPIDEKRLQALENLSERITKTLANSESVKEYTKLNLEGLAELFKISKDIYAFYEVQISRITSVAQDAQKVKSKTAIIASFINKSLESIATATNATLSIYQKCEEALDLATNTYTKLDLRANEMDEVLKQINNLKEQINDIKELESNFKELITKGEELKLQINAIVPNILAEVKTELLSDKDNFEQELQSATTRHLENIATANRQISSKIDEFKAYFTQKETKVDEAIARIDAFLSDLNVKAQEVLTTHTNNLQALQDKKTQYLQEIQTLSTTKTNEFNELNTNLRRNFETLSTTKTNEFNQLHATKRQEIETLSNNKKNEITQQATNKQTEVLNVFETRKNQHLSTFEQHANRYTSNLQNRTVELTNNLNQHTENLRNTMTSIKDNYIREIRNDIPAQVAGLTQLCNEIKASNQAMGNNFVTRVYTAGGTFHPTSPTHYYYIFVQGGTGGTNNTQAGGVTSFGNIISAPGGAGNQHGAGQQGQVRAGFYRLTSTQNMTIPSGGLIIVSYADR